MPIAILDTCILIAYKPTLHSRGIRMSAVVLHEMTMGAADDAEVRYWDLVRKDFDRVGKFFVPNGEDWFLAGKVLNSLQRGRKAANKGKTPKISAAEARRIMRDVLIARTARREKALLVTDNVPDFEKIRSFCKVRTVTGKEFFGVLK
jgi:predicted nucleic acid-binding protein